MRWAVIDTEGSGLFKYKDATGKPVPADDPSQPRLAALSMILLDADLKVVEEYHALVKPDGWSMTAEATAVNGLTDERLMAEGQPVGHILDVYTQAIREGRAVVAFNAQHDLKQMRAELRRAGRDDLFMLTKNVCVMRKAAGHIPRPDGKKTWPKLEHCREHLKISHDAAHTSGADAASALAVFLHLHGLGVDLTPAVHFAKGGDKPDAAPQPLGEALAQSAALADAPAADVPLANQDIPQ